MDMFTGFFKKIVLARSTGKKWYAGSIKEVLFSKFMTSQPGKQIIAIHILPCISRSKGNQTMIDEAINSHLIEYNMRNIFFEKSFTKCGGETIPRPFSKLS